MAFAAPNERGAMPIPAHHRIGELLHERLAIGRIPAVQGTPLDDALHRLGHSEPGNGSAHGIRNEIVASKQRIKARLLNLSLGRKREGQTREKSKGSSTVSDKKRIHERCECENEQTDSLDESIQVEEKLHHERPMNSSDSQTEALGKHS
jgi:hypothetical protein